MSRLARVRLLRHNRRVDASGFMDGKPHDLPCPRCGAIITTTVGELRKSPTLQCPGGHSVVLDSTGFDEGMRQVEQQVEGLKRHLSR